ncbi:hypothetical protein MY11210_001101 [Beauveria gryllotalpidicola]
MLGISMRWTATLSFAMRAVSLDNDPRPAHQDDSDDGNDSDNSDDSHYSHEVYVYVPDPQTYRNVRREDEYDSDRGIHDHVDRNGFGHNHSTRTGQGANHYDANPGPSVERFLNIASDLMGGDRNLRERLHEASQNGPGHYEWADETSRGSVRFYASDGRFVAGEHAPPGSDPFQSIFSSVFHDHEDQLTGDVASAVYGDAVYTEEGLDRVISTLMDANTQSHAGPATSEQALANLSRKTIREGSADGNTDCPICLDALKVDQMGVEATDLRQSLVDSHSKTEPRRNMDVDQIVFRLQEVVRTMDAIHGELADHQTMDRPTGIQHQDPHGHQIRAKHASIKQCGISLYSMVSEANLAVPQQGSATTRQDFKDAAQGRRQALEWR